jgi:hypothetical protein
MALRGNRTVTHRVFLGGGGYLRDGDHMEHLGVDGRIILKLIFKKRNLGGLD